MAGWRKDKKSGESARELKATQLDPRNQTQPADQAAGPSWKRAKKSTAGKAFWVQGSGKKVSKRPPWFVPLVILAGAVVTLVIWLTLRAKTTDMLVFVGLEYSSPWQPNGWAAEDAERFQTLFDKDEALRCAAIIDKETDCTDWENALRSSVAKAEPGGPGGPKWWWKYKTLVVYVSAHGVVGADDKPYLVLATKPGDVLVDKSGNAIPGAAAFEKFIQVLTQSRSDSQILLIVDLGRQLPDARISGARFEFDDANQASQFLARAEDLVEKTSNSQLAVLFSADANQISWPAPERGGTVFGSFVAQGFDGAADAKGNGKVTVLELYNFVRSQVEEYVTQTRASTQQPKLVWGGGVERDFDLAYCKTNTEPIANAPTTGASVTKLETAPIWTKFHDWRSVALTIDPCKVAHVRNEICYAEQLALAGSHYEARAKSKLNEASALMDKALAHSAELTGASFFKGKLTEPTFNLPEPSPEPVKMADAKDQPDSQPVVAKPEKTVLPTYADKARTWLLTPVGPDGKKLAAFPEVKSAQEYADYVQFCWWWLRDSAHWTKESIDGLESLKPQFEQAAGSVRSEDAFVQQLTAEVKHVGSLWNANLSVNDRAPQLLQGLDRIHRIYQQLEHEPRVLLDEETRKALEKVTQKLRVQRDAIHGRILPTLIDESEFAQLEASVQMLTDNWRTLDRCADELPLQANRLIPIGQTSTAEIERMFTAHDQLMANPRRLDSELLPLLTRQRTEYLDSVKRLIESQEGSTTELTPSALRDAYVQLHRLPLDSGNRAALLMSVKSHFDAQLYGRKSRNSATIAKIVTGYRLSLAPQNISAWAEIAKLDNRGDSQGNAELWQSVLDNVVQSKGRLLADAELTDEKLLATKAEAVRLLAGWSAGLPLEQFDAARQQEVVGWNNYLLWRAGEHINDFWRTPSLQADEPYFATCAKSFLKAAVELPHVPESTRSRLISALQARQQQSDNWTNLIAGSSLDAQVKEANQRIEVDTTAYPIGIARAWLKDRRPNGDTPAILPMAKAGVAVGQRALLTYDLIPGANAELIGDYRGHSSTRHLQFRPPQTQWTIAQSFVARPETIAIVSATPQPLEIVFALDCSLSFKSDFDTAREALKNALNELKNRENVKVAFVAFGHSAEWVGDVNSSDIVKVQLAEHVPKKYQTAHDVSDDAVVFVPLTESTKETIRTIEQHIDALQVYGRTPLNFAIKTSIEQLSKTNEKNLDILRRLIVITDGKNEVFPEMIARSRFRPAASDSIEQVSVALGSMPPVQIDILYVAKGLNIKAARELKSLVDQSGGQYIMLNNTDKLRATLLEVLEPMRYSIVHQGQRVQGDAEKYAKFSDQSVLQLAPPREVFEVSVGTKFGDASYQAVATKTVTINEGDQIHIEYDRPSKEFRFPFRNQEMERRSLMLKEVKLQTWRVRPRESAREVRFLIDRFDSPSHTEQTLAPEWSFVELALDTQRPVAKLWSADVFWEMESNRPVGHVQFDGQFKGGPASESSDTILPARFWVCTDAAGPKMVADLQIKSEVSALTVNKWHEISKSRVRLEGNELPGNIYSLEITVQPSQAERLLARPPVADRVEHKFLEDRSVVYTYQYREHKPAGKIGFFLAPTELDTNWAHTEWVSTE